MGLKKKLLLSFFDIELLIFNVWVDCAILGESVGRKRGKNHPKMKHVLCSTIC